jgi:hypothetical protein
MPKWEHHDHPVRHARAVPDRPGGAHPHPRRPAARRSQRRLETAHPGAGDLVAHASDDDAMLGRHRFRQGARPGGGAGSPARSDKRVMVSPVGSSRACVM